MRAKALFVAMLLALVPLPSVAQDNDVGDRVASGIVRVPGMFALPELTTITTLEQALASIPAGIDELRALSVNVQAGVYGADVPTEWQGQLNSALAAAEFRRFWGDRLTFDFIFDDARTERELTVLLNSATASLPPGDLVIRDLQAALRLFD